ncbi:hypothetical protein [Embleya sp. NPDC059259]|uniref:hypothetical protein n=1 Tax=unclassified Embleya TaxID=2699296 RepID=UPI0036A20A12
MRRDAVRIITGDGVLGDPDAGAYDRVQVTASVRHIPAAWIEQARPGTVIVMPWGTDHTTGDCALRLVVDANGQCASGPFTMAAPRRRPRRNSKPREARTGNRPGHSITHDHGRGLSMSRMGRLRGHVSVRHRSGGTRPLGCDPRPGHRSPGP